MSTITHRTTQQIELQIQQLQRRIDNYEDHGRCATTEMLAEMIQLECDLDWTKIVEKSPQTK